MTRERQSIHGALRGVQGFGFFGGGVLALVSLRKSSVVGGLATVELSLAAFALGFVAAAGAAYANEHLRRAGLSLFAAVGVVIVTFEASDLGSVGVTALFLIGLLLLADVFAKGGVRDRFPG